MSDKTEVVLLRKFGGPECLEVVERPMPRPGPGEVRVRVLAASVQFTDLILRRGSYPDLKEKPPIVLGYDVVGEVEELGPGVTTLRVGDRVADLTMTGSYARHRLLVADRVTKVPPGVDAAEAASVVLGAMTALQLLHRVARVKGGERVLILGAAGSVGQALVGLGKLEGLEMWGSARASHAELVRSLGATPIDYKTADLAQVRPEGFDVVFDGIGEQGFAKSWAAVKRGGILSAYGFSSGIQAGVPFLKIGAWLLRLHLWGLLPNGKRTDFYSITAMRSKHPDWFRADLGRLFALLEAGSMRPRIAERIGLRDVADAHRRLEAGGLEGKIVLQP